MTVDSAALDEALAQSAEVHGPGLLGFVTEGGEAVFEGSIGVADLRHPRPIDAHDQFRIGSVTKTYVAVVVLQLVAEGALSLSDSVQRWLPGLVPQGDEITVEVLLLLRSGLPDYVGPIFGDPPDLSVLDRYWSPEQLVGMALTGRDRLAPDTEFRYSNTDYVLLGMVIEQVTGQRVEAQMWQRIFRPLGLRGTTFPTVDPDLRGQHATGYLRATPDAAFVEFTAQSPSEAWTAGAVVSTAADVAAFLDGLFEGRLLDADSLARMTDCPEVVDEHRSRGLGIVRYDFGHGAVAYGHTGGVPGYSTVAMRTTAGRGVVLLQNGIDVFDPLTSDDPFIQAALR